MEQGMTTMHAHHCWSEKGKELGAIQPGCKVFLADMRAAIWLQHSTSTLALSHDCKNISEPIKTAFHIYKRFCCSLGRQLLVTMIFWTAMTEKVHWEWSEANFVINKNWVWQWLCIKYRSYWSTKLCKKTVPWCNRSLLSLLASASVVWGEWKGGE